MCFYKDCENFTHEDEPDCCRRCGGARAIESLLTFYHGVQTADVHSEIWDEMQYLPGADGERVRRLVRAIDKCNERLKELAGIVGVADFAAPER